jgi:hypothetical protein
VVVVTVELGEGLVDAAWSPAGLGAVTHVRMIPSETEIDHFLEVYFLRSAPQNSPAPST